MSPGRRVADTSRYRGRPASYRYSSIRQCIHCGFLLLIIVSISLKVFPIFLLMTFCRYIYISLQWYKISVFTSVGDPDPQDPHVFGPPGSGSISQRYRYRSGSGSGSFPFLLNVSSGSGSMSHGYGDPDPDSHQNVTDP
jgi:hypothetical protein